MAKPKSRHGTQSKRKSQQRDGSVSASSSVDLNGSLSLRTLASEWRRPPPLHSTRKDSVLDNTQQHCEQEARSRAKELAGQSWAWLHNIRNPFPGVRDWIISTRFWRYLDTHPGPNTLVINAIGICLVFGALKVVLDSLLLATRVSAAYSASASTVYFPFTVSIPELSLASSTGVPDFPSSTSYTTVSTFTTTVSRTTTITASETSLSSTEVLTTTATVTATVSLFTTVTASPSPGSSVPSGPAYSFHVSSGSTIWQDGATPPVSASLNIVTTSVVVIPLPTASAPAADGSSISSSLVSEALTTFTAPPYSSTTFQVVSPALTTTLTSTHYITRSLSRVSAPPQSSRASFTGVNSAGWNASSTQDAVLTNPVASTSSRFTKFTRMVYFGHDDVTTSTSTQLVTVTVGEAPATSSGSVMDSPVILSSALPTSSGNSGSLPTQSTQDESQASGVTLPTSSSVSLGGIHQTIAASGSSSSSYTISSVLSTSSLPGVSSASNASATATMYTITTFSSGEGTTITLQGFSSSLTPEITAVDGSSFGSASTVSGSRLTANSSSSRATSGASPLPSVVVFTTSSRVGPPSSPVSEATSLSSPSQTLPTESGLFSSGSSTNGATSRTGLNTQSATSPSSWTASSGQSIESTTRSSLANLESATFITSIRTSTSSVSSRNSTSLVTVTLPQPTTTSTSAGASAIPTCGEQGDFTMNFDDLPTFHSGSARLRKRQSLSWNSTSANGNDTSDITQQPPLSMRPYKHMLFSSGYVYAPQPVEPFAPASTPNVAVFLANGTGLRAGAPPSTQNGLEPGEIADGPYHEGQPAFFFNPRSAALGCDSQTTPCTMEVTAYTWNDTVKDDVPTYYENYTLPACERYRNCQMTTVTFPPTFRNLSGIRMRAVRGSEPRTFFVDDIEASWADSSCESGKTRQNSP